MLVALEEIADRAVGLEYLYYSELNERISRRFDLAKICCDKEPLTCETMS
jgi:hypothetical protein